MPKEWIIENEPIAAQLAEIARTLTSGGVVLLPTDTIYGLHAGATDDAAVAKIAAVKGRDDGKPFVVIGASAAQLASAGVVFTAPVLAALEELWPAPLTAVLPLDHPWAASRGGLTLAVRVPAVAWLRRLLTSTGPLASTSANRSGEPPVEAPEKLARDMHFRLDGVVDAGPLSGKPSMIVDFTGGEPRVLREVSSFFTQEVWKTLRKTL